MNSAYKKEIRYTLIFSALLLICGHLAESYDLRISIAIHHTDRIRLVGPDGGCRFPGETNQRSG